MFGFTTTGGFPSQAARGEFSLQLSLRFTGRWCRIGPCEVLWRMPSGVDSLLRSARCAARRGNCIATAVADVIFVAIAILIVTVGVLATESRIYTPGQNPTTWHTSKSSRMAECGGDKLSPAQTDDSRPAPPVKATETAVSYFLFPLELPLPKLVGVPQAHGLRAPPRL